MRTEVLSIIKKYLDGVPDFFNQNEKEFIQASYDLPHRKVSLNYLCLTILFVLVFVPVVRIFGLMQPIELFA